MNKLVSVIIPTFNGAKTIKRAIESVLNQEYKELEIIVVIDPATTDNTKEIIQSFNNEKISIIQSDRERSASYSRNLGIKASKGEYIAFLDDDDGWESDKLTLQLEYLERNPQYDCVIGDYTYFTNESPKKYSSKSENYTRDILLMKVKIAAGSNLLVRRQKLFEINLFDDRFEGHQDLELSIRLDQKGRIGHIDKNLVNIYGRSGRVASNATKLLRVKEMFLAVFKTIIESFPKNIQNEIYARQWLQVSRAFALENNIEFLLKYLKLSLSYKFLFSSKFLIIPFESYYLIAYHYLATLFKKRDKEKI